MRTSITFSQCAKLLLLLGVVTLTLPYKKTYSQSRFGLHELPLWQPITKSPVQLIFSNSMLSGAHHPLTTSKESWEHKGTLQHYSLNGVYRSYIGMIRLQQNSSDHLSESSFHARSIQLNIGKFIWNEWLVGFALENYYSENSTRRTTTESHYQQPGFIISQSTSYFSWSLMYAPLHYATVHSRDHTTHARRSIDGQISSYILWQGDFQTAGEGRMFSDISYDMTDAVSSDEEKLNAPLRVKGLLIWSFNLADEFMIELGYLRNRNWFSRLSSPSRHPYQMLGTLMGIAFSPHTKVNLGFATDFGGLLNSNKHRERWNSFQFGFSHLF